MDIDFSCQKVYTNKLGSLTYFIYQQISFTANAAIFGDCRVFQTSKEEGMDNVTTRLELVVQKYYRKKPDHGRVDLRPVAQFLGNVSDEDIAKAVGVPPRKIRKFREHRRIAKFVSPIVEVSNEKREIERLLIPVVDERGTAIMDKEDRTTKNILELTGLEMDILRFFLGVVEKVGEDKYRARKTTKEIQDAISDGYDYLKWYHIRCAVKSLEKRHVILRVNGIKKEESNPALHPRITFQLNADFLASCAFHEIERRSQKEPTYRRKIMSSEQSSDVKSSPSVDQVITESEHLELQKDLMDKAVRYVDEKEMEIKRIRLGLDMIEDIRRELQSRMDGLREKIAPLRSAVESANKELQKVKDLLPKI